MKRVSLKNRSPKCVETDLLEWTREVETFDRPSVTQCGLAAQVRKKLPPVELQCPERGTEEECDEPVTELIFH